MEDLLRNKSNMWALFVDIAVVACPLQKEKETCRNNLVVAPLIIHHSIQLSINVH